jgi:hypothetical protein
MSVVFNHKKSFPKGKEIERMKLVEMKIHLLEENERLHLKFLRSAISRRVMLDNIARHLEQEMEYLDTLLFHELK